MLQKVAEGSFRDVYLSECGTEVIKQVKSWTVKHRLGGDLRVPAAGYARFKYGISDLNAHEYANYERLPFAFTDFIPDLVENRSDGLHMRYIRNEDGTRAHTLEELGTSVSKEIMGQMEDIAQICLDSKVYFMDLFTARGQNMVVQQTDSGEKPVIIDFKKIGGQMYPFQPWLKVESQVRKKFERRVQRFFEYWG